MTGGVAMKPDAVTEMKAFLKERYGIETHDQLIQRIRQAPRINLAIFNEVMINDYSGSPAKGRKPCGAKAG